MSTRLLLDGADVDVLLRRVLVELGPDAVVVESGRVRSGGFAGFFAKEHLELTVDVPSPWLQPGAGRQAPAAGAQSCAPTPGPAPGADRFSALLASVCAQSAPSGPLGVWPVRAHRAAPVAADRAPSPRPAHRLAPAIWPITHPRTSVRRATARHRQEAR
jgi:hypothetical protein